MFGRHVGAHHGRYHHHHHHHPSLAGAVLGGMVVGSLLSSSSSNNRSHYRSYDNSYAYASPPRAVVPYATPEEIAAREKAYQEELERRRKAEAERLAELERQRIATLQREDAREQERCHEYRMHVTLINEVKETHPEILFQKINALPVLSQPIDRHGNSVYKGIPENGGSTLFSAILFRDDLMDDVKRQLLDLLVHQKGYDKWVIRLFTQPLYSKMLENQPCFQLLERIYSAKLVNLNILSPETERHFWQVCLQNSTMSAVDHYRMQTNHSKKFQMLTDWINSKTRATDVINVYESIQARDFGLSDVHLRRFLKIAKQKILDIEIKNHTSSHEGEDDQRIRVFLDIHRGTWTSCFACFFTRRSTDIHRMIQQGDFNQATNAWNTEERALRGEFHRRHGLK